MFCSECGHENMEEELFCAKCGNELVKDEAAIPCCAYGYENIGGEIFCSECGRKLTKKKPLNTEFQEVKNETAEENLILSKKENNCEKSH